MWAYVSVCDGPAGLILIFKLKTYFWLALITEKRGRFVPSGGILHSITRVLVLVKDMNESLLIQMTERTYLNDEGRGSEPDRLP